MERVVGCIHHERAVAAEADTASRIPFYKTIDNVTQLALHRTGLVYYYRDACNHLIKERIDLYPVTKTKS